MNSLILGDNLQILQNLSKSTGVFIDAGNVFFTQKNMKWKIDWLKFKKLFPKNTKFYYFTAFDVKNPLQIKHNSFLANNKFKLFTKPLHLIAGNHKGNMDVELTWEMSKSIPNLETFVLVSGDGDFEYILSDLKNNFRKNVLVIGSQSNTNYKLIQNFKFVSLEKIQSKIQFLDK